MNLRVATRIAFGVVVAGAAGAGAWWWLHNGPARKGVRLHTHQGRITAAWSGAHTARVSLPAQVTWCPITRQAVLDAIVADTGIEVVFYEQDSLAPGTRPVIGPRTPATVPRPAATLALRYPPEPDSLAGYRSTDGTAQLTVQKGTVSGTISARLHAAVGNDTLRFLAAFDRLPLTATAAGCR
jgi:hypothetical protein